MRLKRLLGLGPQNYVDNPTTPYQVGPNDKYFTDETLESVMDDIQSQLEADARLIESQFPNKWNTLWLSANRDTLRVSLNEENAKRIGHKYVVLTVEQRLSCLSKNLRIPFTYTYSSYEGIGKLQYVFVPKQG